ncbi:MAG: type III secretion inner membrane ring lipoprotein SctJ [Alphaproteobacteria bacterium]|nr:type III secretion inner membrane ring lipoprotein SctJ [Alphaproteobacteria bacterium]
MRIYRTFGAARLLAFGLCLLLAACKVELHSGLDQRDANEIMAILLKNGISASRSIAKDKTLTVVVEEERFAEAVDILQAHSLPREKFNDLCSVFTGEGMISSPIEDRARLICALSQELSRTISEIDGVMSARVHVVLPENDLGRSKAKPSSASVFIRHHEDAPIDKLSPQIKMLVANGIEGLVYDKVSIAMVPVISPVEIATSSNDYTTVAGLWVHTTSALRARFTIYLLVALLLAALGANGYLYWQWRLRPSRPTPSAAKHLPAE